MAAAALAAALRDRGFYAAAGNFLLMAVYVWADYGRGFITLHPDLLDAIFIAGAWAYVVDQMLYISLHAGEQPWPSGWTMLSEWLGVAGTFCYAATSIMYLDKSGALAVQVLFIEAFGAVVYVAAAITSAAGWWLERPIDGRHAAEKGAVWLRVLRDPYAWAHATNFLPAIVYVASSLTAAELHFFKAPPSAENADAPQFSALLRQLSRVYWYGDILWAANGALWLWLYFADAEGGEGGEGGGDGDGGGSGADSSGAASPEKVGARGGLQIRLLEEEPARAPARLRRVAGQAPRRWRVKETTPYVVLGPLYRTASCLFGAAAVETLGPPPDEPAAAPAAGARAAAPPPPQSPRAAEAEGGAPAAVRGGGTGRVLRLAAGAVVLGAAQAVSPRPPLPRAAAAAAGDGVEMKTFSLSRRE
jgi:hypothetical protein